MHCLREYFVFVHVPLDAMLLHDMADMLCVLVFLLGHIMEDLPVSSGGVLGHFGVLHAVGQLFAQILLQVVHPFHGYPSLIY